MRYLLFLIICTIGFETAWAKSSPVDSLLCLLPQKKTPQERCEAYRNLADLSFETPAEKIYLKQCYQEAEKAGDRVEKLEALRDLAYAYRKENQHDSTQHYMNIIRQEGKDEIVMSQITYLNICLANGKMEPEELEAIQKELESRYKKENNVYSKVEYAAFIGNRMLWKEKHKEAIPYLQTAVELAVTIPFKEGFKLQTLLMHILSLAYTASNQFDKSVNLIERSIKLRTDYFQKYYKKKRPFYYINTYYIQSYTALLTNSEGLSQTKINTYLEKLTALCQHSTNSMDKYSYFLSLYNYYDSRNNSKQALSSCDSLIKYAEHAAPYNLPALYQVSSQLHQSMGNYEQALYSLKTSHSLSDSTANAKSREQLNRMQVQYKVDKLNYEKSQLEIKNKQIQLITLSTILLIAVAICIYLYKTLKKEQRMKAHLRLLKMKAEESEKMKTAFINSICHEIHTPLNAIVGFTELAFSEEIDEETRSTFPQEVQKNTTLLTNLINSMLEVSNLDVSDEKLPCEPTDINAIFQHELACQKASEKQHLEYYLDIPQTPLIINSNARYLALVIENLLNNAEKFTDNGSVTLHYHIDTEQNKLEISVTDTGCGIPQEKHEDVFERFIKLDTYKQGNGLGLYLCRLIIKRLSGRISIDSTYTEGTRVLISLPTNL